MNSQNNLGGDKQEFVYGFSSYGVKIGLAADDAELLNKMKTAVDFLPLNPTEIVYDEAQYYFKIDYSGEIYTIIKNGDELDTRLDESVILKYLQVEVRITVAEFAVSKVFVHAGAVSFNGFGIIFPAQSFHGKSTLTLALVKAGADYYSDDYAILDENARLLPFPRQISLRGIDGEHLHKDYPIEHFGGRVGIEPVEIKLVLITEFEKGFKWSPEVISPGNAVLEMIPHTIPIRFNPEFSLLVLHKLVNNAIIARSKRGDVGKFVDDLLKFIKTIDSKSPKPDN